MNPDLKKINIFIYKKYFFINLITLKLMGLKSNVERCHYLLMVFHVLKINFEIHEQWITLLLKVFRPGPFIKS